MRGRLKSWARPIAGVLVMAFALTSAPAVSAAEPGAAAKPQKKTLTDAALERAAKAPKAALMQGTSTGAPSDAAEKGFFRTPKGVVAAVLFVAGAGWAIYSTKHDRDPVKSPIR